MYRVIALLTAAGHFAFIGYVVVGGLLALRWRRSIWLHLPAATWGMLVVAGHLDCPLTHWENWARQRAGMTPLPPEGFVSHYITGVLYPAGWGGVVQLVVVAAIAASWLRYAVAGSRPRRAAGDTVVDMRVLVICDVQKDFCEGGALAVEGGAAVAAAISRYLHRTDRYQHVVATCDRHIDPGDHFSEHPDFVSSWPPHCVAGSDGARFHPDLDTAGIEAVFAKGAHSAAYSGFEGVDESGTALLDWLRAHDVRMVDMVGIATDHCVRATAEDAVRAGFETRVLTDLTAGVATASTEAALVALRAAGVDVVEGAA